MGDDREHEGGKDGYQQDPDQKVAPGASGPGEPGYDGDVQIGDE